jgi:uncharacterized membrane protein (UPF0127 family)/CheY-like chemotaxis protein
MGLQPLNKSDFLILIVDDEKDFLTSMEFWFKTQGYSVAAVSSGDEALEFLKTKKPNVIFLDYFMPGMNGLEVLGKIRALSKDIPVVLLSAHADESVRFEAYRLGVNGVFNKSLGFYNAEHILNSLVRVMSRERSGRRYLSKRSIAFTSIVLAFFLGVLFIAKTLFWEPQVCLGDSCVKVELAQAQEDRAEGLKYRSSLADGQGMLFVFPEEGYWPFWMKDTYISLDIIWLDRYNRVVEIIENALPAPGVLEPPSFGGIYPSRYVLEVNAGFAKKNGVKVGQEVTFKWIFPQKRL